MASAAPPKGYVALAPAVWGTDMERNSVFPDSGEYSIEFLTQLRYLVSDYRPVSPSSTYRISARYGSSSSGSSAVFKIDWYTNALVPISTSTVTGAIATAGVWEESVDSVLSPATAAYCKIRLAGSFAPPVTFYISKLSFGPGPDYFSVSSKLVTQSIPTGTWTTVEFPSSNLGGSSYQIFDNANDRFAPTKSKPMLFNWSVGIDSVVSQGYVLSSLYNNTTEIARGSRANNASSSARDVESTGSRVIGVKPGDLFYVKVVHNHGSARNTSFSIDGHLPLFSATEIGF